MYTRGKKFWACHNNYEVLPFVADKYIPCALIWSCSDRHAGITMSVSCEQCEHTVIICIQNLVPQHLHYFELVYTSPIVSLDLSHKS